MHLLLHTIQTTKCTYQQNNRFHKGAVTYIFTCFGLDVDILHVVHMFNRQQQKKEAKFNTKWGKNVHHAHK